MNPVTSAACPADSGLTIAMAHPRVQSNGHRHSVIDVLTIGEEAKLLRPVQRALLGSRWIVRHAPTVQAALGILDQTSVAVAVIDAQRHWAETLSLVRSGTKPPEVILVAAEDVSVDEVFSAGAHDLLRHPLETTDLLWSLATAWHTWMKEFAQPREYE
jgi:DNA-binding response OmpR family regulator